MEIVRLNELRQQIKSRGLEVCLVSQSENLRYLSGFTGSSGWLIVSLKMAFLAVDSRYTEQAKNEAPQFEIYHTKGDITSWLPGLLKDMNCVVIGFEANAMSYSLHHSIFDVLYKQNNKTIFTPVTGIVESMRAIKNSQEQEIISRSTNLADSALEYAKSIIKPGITEQKAAWEIEKFLREHGSETLPFEIIVASGSNSALPHAKPSERTIKRGEPVLIDLGARINGYCSDLSRTYWLGKADSKFSKLYDIVLGAQLTALSTIESGISGDQADNLARIVIGQANYGDSFGHGLGHGIGLSVHESPRIGPASSDILYDGMAFTVEPGIYIPGWGGIRIEDTVIMQSGKIRNLSKADKMAII